MENNNGSSPYRCTLNISVPSGKERRFQKIVSPLIKWVDPSFQMLQILNDNNSFWKTTTNNVSVSLKDCAETSVMVPALSVMVFLYEHGTLSAISVQNSLKKKPWKFHHKVELHSKWTPDRAVAAQVFYGLADDLPLWSVCPVHCGNEHFRVLIHVRNFKKMMEFYRCVTDVEIESSKPGFCIFQLYSQPGLDIQIALKHSKNIQPYPIPNACLTFEIKNMDLLRTYMDVDVTEIEDRTFLVKDPDGNVVVLKEQFSSGIITDYEPVEISQNRDKCKTPKYGTNGYSKELRCSSDSQDSGRCSDSDMWISEVEHIKRCPSDCFKNSFCPRHRQDINTLSADGVSKYYQGQEANENRNCGGGQTQLTFDTTKHQIATMRELEAPVYL